RRVDRGGDDDLLYAGPSRGGLGRSSDSRGAKRTRNPVLKYSELRRKGFCGWPSVRAFHTEGVSITSTPRRSGLITVSKRKGWRSSSQRIDCTSRVGKRR